MDTPNTPTKATDKELVALVQGGDNSAFGELYSRSFDVIRDILINKTGSSRQDAEDVTQQAFIKAMKNMASFQNRSSFKTWVYRIAHNVFLDSIKGKKNNCLSLEAVSKDDQGRDYILPDQVLDHDSPDKILNKKQETLKQLIKLDAVKKKLSENQQKIFDLVFVQDKSYKEAAEELNCAIGTVMSRVFFTRQKLKKMLKPIKIS